MRDFRARGKLTLVEVVAAKVETDLCFLCDGAIDRFDSYVFAASRHCCSCHAAISE